MTDAAHLLTDALAIVISLIALGQSLSRKLTSYFWLSPC